MLEAKTKEQKNFVVNKLLAHNYEFFETPDGCGITIYMYMDDDYYSFDLYFDDMAEIVDYLRSQNNKQRTDMKELDELKEKCVQAMKDVNAFVDEHYDELCNEIREQWNVPEDWIVKIVSNCGIVHGCCRQSDKDEWFRVIYNNGKWMEYNF